MRRAALVVVALVFALAGCTALANLSNLREDIEAEGYNVTGLTHNTTNGHAVVRVVATSDGGGADRIAEVVWTNYPGEVDEVVVVLDGGEALDLSADELTAKFGDRPESLGDVAKKGPNVTVIVVAVVGALLLAALVVVVWLRGRRPPPAVPPRPSHAPYPPQYPG